MAACAACKVIDPSMFKHKRMNTFRHDGTADLVSLPDALVTVVTRQGALQSLPADELGVSGPGTKLQGHIVDIDELEAGSTNDSADQATSVLWQGY